MQFFGVSHECPIAQLAETAKGSQHKLHAIAPPTNEDFIPNEIVYHQLIFIDVVVVGFSSVLKPDCCKP